MVAPDTDCELSVLEPMLEETGGADEGGRLGFMLGVKVACADSRMERALVAVGSDDVRAERSTLSAFVVLPGLDGGLDRKFVSVSGSVELHSLAEQMLSVTVSVTVTIVERQ